MNHLYTIDLTINMPAGGRQARQLVNLYLPDIDADINATASKLCGADPDVLARKFAKLTVKRADVWSNQEHTMKIFALLSVSGEDAGFVQKVIEKYMEDFPDCLKKASARYYTRTTFPPEIPLQPTDWKVDLH